MTDSDIIRLFFDRDEQAIAETAEKYGRYCMTIARDILASEQDAEECVSDVYLKVWNSIPPDAPASLKAYIAVLTRRLSINRYHEGKAQKRNRDFDLSLEELADCIPAPDEAADVLPALFNEFLGGLDPTERKLFVGRYWHLYPVSTLADAYNLTPNNTSVRLHRLREKLRAHLTERGFTV